jgi:hypothetical protein
LSVLPNKGGTFSFVPCYGEIKEYDKALLFPGRDKMADVKVNKMLWNAVSEVEKQHIEYHLRTFGVLEYGQKIVTDAENTQPIKCEQAGEQDKRKNISALGTDWICRNICELAKAESGTCCSLSEKSLNNCLTIIAASRVAYRQQTEFQSDKQT